MFKTLLDFLCSHEGRTTSAFGDGISLSARGFGLRDEYNGPFNCLMVRAVANLPIASKME